MISAIFTELGTIISSFTTMFSGLITNAVSVFYSGTALTDVGKLTLMGLGCGLFIFGLHFVRSLIRVRTK